MEVIQGFSAAAKKLSRRTLAESSQISQAARQKLREVFGKEIGIEQAVQQIIHDVQEHGDSAVLDYTLRIDGWKPAALEVTKTQIKAAYSQVPSDLIDALKVAAARIREFHEEQKRSIWHGVKGEEWGQMVRPLERVGLYTPASTAIYPSTLLMTGVPAKVAGVKEIILCTPPRNRGEIPPATLVAGDIAGVDRIFGIGGAQAIAAMAFGTQSVPGVDKICGPGNLFVMLAKRAVFGVVDIDAMQGPSEVLVIADETANPEYCAADLLAQAEHDALPQAVLVTTSRQQADRVQEALERQLASLSRRHQAAESLESRGIIAIVDTVSEAIELSNLYAPEHLELIVKDAESYLDKVKNAGCVFVGQNSTVPMGDYIMGPSHSLPTGGTARFSSPLNILDFVKLIDVVKVSQANLRELGPSAITIAKAEGFEAHAKAIQIRLDTK